MEPAARHYYPENIKKLLVRMTYHMCTKDIVDATGISRWTIRRALHRWECTGSVVSKSIMRGRPRVLDPVDAAVCPPLLLNANKALTLRINQYIQGCVDHTPDISLEEIRQKLEYMRGTFVSTSTIGRCLIRRDYSCKQVRI
jgi:transposase